MASKDIQLKILEKELYEKGRLINSTSDMIWVIDSEMRLVAFNDSYKQAIEITQHRAIKPYDPVLVKEFGTRLYNKWKVYYERALSGKAFKIIEQVEIAGKSIFGEIAFRPVTKNGQIIGVSCFNRDITELKESEQKLKRNEELLRSVVQDQQEMIVRWKPGGYRTFVNQAYCETFEEDPEETIGKSFFPTLEKPVRKAFEEAIKKLTVKNPTRRYIAHILLPSGEKRWQEWTDRAYFDEKGHVVEYQSVGRDITQLKEIEENLKKSKEQFSTVIQDQDEMIVRWRPGGIRTFVNNAYLKFYDLKEEEAIGTSFYDLISPKDRKRIKKEIEELSPENPTRENVHSVLLPDGTTGWQRWKDRAFFNEQGEPLEYQSVGQDITQLVESQKALEESEERYRTVFNQQFQFTALLDLEGKVELVNDLPLQTQGVSREDYLGKFFWDSPAWRGNETWQEKIKRQVLGVKETAEPLIVEDAFYGEDGEVRYAKASYKLINNSEGKAECILVQAMDITEEKKAKEEIQKQKQRLSLIYNNTTDFMVLFRCEKKEYIIEELNKNCEKFIDIFDIPLTKEELLGYSLKDAFKEFIHLPDKEIQERLQVFDLIKKNKQLVSYEREMDTPKGFLVTQAEVIPVVQGLETTHLLMIARDITQSYLTRKQIIENERQLSAIYNNVSDFMALFRYKEGKFFLESMNNAFIEANKKLGVDIEYDDILGGELGENMKTFGFDDALIRERIDRYEQVVATKKDLSYIEVSYVKGNTVYGDSRLTPIFNERGEIAYVLWTSKDITDSFLSKKQIEESQKKLSLIYNSSNDFMLLMKVEQSGYFIDSVNDATLKGLERIGIKIDRIQLEGMNMRTFMDKVLHYSQTQIGQHYKVYHEVRKNKETIRYTTESEYDGRNMATDTSATPIVESGEVKYILTVSRDITDLVRSKQELKEAYGELEKLKSKVERENIYLKEEIRQANDFENMVFRSTEFRNVLNKVDQVAKTDATVLITGETGTGKELIARALHNTSKRSEKPLIKVNMAAIPRDLIESELFGYMRGAFTGAVMDKPGKFELADGGSIFLDEIGDMPIELQVKILRVLQEGEVERLGGTKVKKIDVRIITATNKNLEQAVVEGKFREDLLYRIKVFPIEIPPLRSRPSDIPLLVEHFITRYNLKHSKNIRSVPKKVMDYLRSYSWPGNIRELENTIERAVILTLGESLYLPEVKPTSADSEKWTHENALDVVQENHIRRILKECHWKIEGEDGAAAQLKIKPSTLRDKMRKFSIERP